MFRRTLLIAFALCLSCSASCNAQPPPARATPQDETGTLGVIISPKTFVCGPSALTPPPGLFGEKPRPIPPGKQIKDLCPAGESAYLFLDPFPSVSDIPPPVDLAAQRPQETQPDTTKKSP